MSIVIQLGLVILFLVGMDYWFWMQMCMSAEQMRKIQTYEEAVGSGFYRRSLLFRLPLVVACSVMACLAYQFGEDWLIAATVGMYFIYFSVTLFSFLKHLNMLSDR